MKEIICIITILISSCLFLGFIYLCSCDDIRIISKSVLLIISLISIGIVDVLLCYLYKITIKYFALSVMSLYLILTAYIDSCTMNVYRFLNVIFAAIGIVLLIIFHIEVNSQLLGVLIYIGIVALVTYTRGIGKGDAFTLLTIIPYMMFLNYSSDFLLLMLIDTLIFNILFIIFNIRKIDFRKMKLQSKSAFTPSIAIATIFIIIVNGVLNINM